MGPPSASVLLGGGVWDPLVPAPGPHTVPAHATIFVWHLHQQHQLLPQMREQGRGVRVLPLHPSDLPEMLSNINENQ